MKVLGALGGLGYLFDRKCLWNGCRPDLLTGQGHLLVKAIHLMGAMLIWRCLSADSILFEEMTVRRYTVPPLNYTSFTDLSLPVNVFFDIPSEDLQFAMVSDFRH